jgi:cation:H+ antiporter
VSVALALALFGLSLVTTLAAAALFADRLDHLGPRLGIPESLTGLLTALAADGPEISSALIALAQGEKAVSLGIVVGSNAFNLAAMIGLSAVLTGSVALRREPLLVEGAVGLFATVIAGGLVIGILHPVVGALAFGALLVPYVVFLARSPTGYLTSQRPRPAGQKGGAVWRPAALVILAVVVIVAGSAGMVRSGVALAEQWDLPKSLVGVLILAIGTSLPNAYTGVRLGLSHRGAALVSETLNSNTLNLAGGVMLPALVIGLGSASGNAKFGVGWLIVMTLASVLLLARRKGVGRPSGVILIALYFVFVGIQLAR